MVSTRAMCPADSWWHGRVYFCQIEFRWAQRHTSIDLLVGTGLRLVVLLVSDDPFSTGLAICKCAVDRDDSVLAREPAGTQTFPPTLSLSMAWTSFNVGTVGRMCASSAVLPSL
jgi:hypothetical protein